MGGSCTKCSTAVVSPMSVSFDQIPPTTMVPSTSKSTRFIENCLVIWLFDDPSKKYENEKEQIRRLVYELETFTNPDTCIDYIKTIEDEKIFLITSVTYQSIKAFSNLLQIEKIYIFDLSTQQSNSSNIYSDIHLLYKHLEFDLNLCEYDLMHYSILSSQSLISMNLTKQEIAFIFTQLSNKIINRLKLENTSKDVWIDFCRLHYSNHNEQLNIINQFAKNYRPNNALDWLTKSCFISKILNRMKRTREIDVLYKLGFFIKHLNMQLIRLHEENSTLIKKISLVYRGKTMKKDEFNSLLRNNINGMICFSNFLLTTTNKDDIINFLHHRISIHSEMIGINFEIFLDHMIFNEENPYALIKSNEICFSPGTVFRIESIEETIHNSLNLWIIKLKLIQNDDSQIIPLLTPYLNNELHENPLSCLGKLLIDMGEYRRAEQFFLELLNDSTIQSQPRRIVRVQCGLAANYTHKGEHNTALVYYKKALQMSLTYLPADHSDLTILYKNIADCYFNQNLYNDALENYKRAIQLIKTNMQTSKSTVINDLENLINKTKELIENNK